MVGRWYKWYQCRNIGRTFALQRLQCKYQWMIFAFFLLHEIISQVLLIDWSEGSRTINYFGAAGRVPTVGAFAASYLDFLHENGFITWDRINVVGFSLGGREFWWIRRKGFFNFDTFTAHIAGHTGKNVRRGRIPIIIGLDPAGPLFSVGNAAGRIASTDADYVEIIHTNGPTLWVAGAGIGRAIGHAGKLSKVIFRTQWKFDEISLLRFLAQRRNKSIRVPHQHLLAWSSCWLLW